LVSEKVIKKKQPTVRTSYLSNLSPKQKKKKELEKDKERRKEKLTSVVN
jgi:hypothetical protein